MQIVSGAPATRSAARSRGPATSSAATADGSNVAAREPAAHGQRGPGQPHRHRHDRHRLALEQQPASSAWCVLTGANNTIGGTAAGAGNVISGSHNPSGSFNSNYGSGIWLASGATGNVVQGNLIGTDGTAFYALANSSDGIRLDAGASGNLIGGLEPAARNVISGNLAYGVHLVTQSGQPGPTGNLIQGNFIGTDGTGTPALGNASAE